MKQRLKTGWSDSERAELPIKQKNYLAVACFKVKDFARSPGANYSLFSNFPQSHGKREEFVFTYYMIILS